MLNTQTIKNLTDLRSNPRIIMELARELGQPIYIFNRSRPESVLLDIKDYEALIEKLEDVHDVKDIKKLQKKSKDLKIHID